MMPRSNTHATRIVEREIARQKSCPVCESVIDTQNLPLERPKIGDGEIRPLSNLEYHPIRVIVWYLCHASATSDLGHGPITPGTDVVSHELPTILRKTSSLPIHRHWNSSPLALYHT